MSLYLQLSPYSVLSVRRKQYGTGEYDQDGTNNRASSCLQDRNGIKLPWLLKVVLQHLDCSNTKLLREEGENKMCHGSNEDEGRQKRDVPF